MLTSLRGNATRLPTLLQASDACQMLAPNGPIANNPWLLDSDVLVACSKDVRGRTVGDPPYHAQALQIEAACLVYPRQHPFMHISALQSNQSIALPTISAAPFTWFSN
jgi:hypothetical protein